MTALQKSDAQTGRGILAKARFALTNPHGHHGYVPDASEVIDGTLVVLLIVALFGALA